MSANAPDSRPTEPSLRAKGGAPNRPTVAAIVSAACLALGLLGGTLADKPPPRPVSMRGGYRVLEADFHAHSTFSDGTLSPFDLVLQARRRGLDAFAITEHNQLFPSLLGRWFSRSIGGPTVIPGEEITTGRWHLIAIGLTHRVVARQPLGAVLDEVHAQGGLAIAAHPVTRFWGEFTPVRDRLDGAEVLHPIAYSTRGNGWSWSSMRDFYVKARADGFPLTAIGSSDYHSGSVLGVCRTLVFATDDSEGSILDAIAHGRTVVYDLEGKPYGDPSLIALLAADPITPRANDYRYHGASFLDRATRTLGFLGALGLLLFRRRAI